jgi:hypothetical protein
MSLGGSNKMSKQTPSKDFNFEYRFHVTFGEEHFLSKMERWAKRQPFPISFLLEGFVVWLEKIYYEYKVENTMAEVDKQTESIRKQWEEEDVKEEPIYTSEPSEVEGLNTIGVQSPYFIFNDRDWLSDDPNSWYQGPLALSEIVEERPKEEPDTFTT